MFEDEKDVLLPRYDVFSNNLRTKACIVKWSYDGTELLRSSVSVCSNGFNPFFFCSTAACCAGEISRCSGLDWYTTATGVLLWCQSRQSVGGIVGVIDH